MKTFLAVLMTIILASGYQINDIEKKNDTRIETRKTETTTKIRRVDKESRISKGIDKRNKNKSIYDINKEAKIKDNSKDYDSADNGHSEDENTIKPKSDISKDKSDKKFRTNNIRGEFNSEKLTDDDLLEITMWCENIVENKEDLIRYCEDNSSEFQRYAKENILIISDIIIPRLLDEGYIEMARLLTYTRMSLETLDVYSQGKVEHVLKRAEIYLNDAYNEYVKIN